MTIEKPETSFIPTGGAEAVNQSIPAGQHVVGERKVTTQADLEQGQQTSETPEEKPVDDAAQASSGESQQEEQIDPQTQAMQEIVRQLQEMKQTQAQAEQDRTKTPDQIAEAATFETQRTQLEQQKMEASGAIEAQLAEVQRQMEEGDLDVTKGVQQMTALQRQLLQTENQFDKQIASIDLRLEQQQMQAESQIRQAREQFLQSEQGFGEFYQSVYNQKYKNDPVFGDPVAAYYKERFDASEAEKAEFQRQLEERSKTVLTARQPEKVSPVASSGVATTGQQQKSYPRGAMGTYQRLVDQGKIQAT